MAEDAVLYVVKFYKAKFRRVGTATNSRRANGSTQCASGKKAALQYLQSGFASVFDWFYWVNGFTE